MNFKSLGEDITTTLTIKFEANGQTTYLQADETPELKVYYNGVLEFRTYPDGKIENPTPGVYEHVWSPSKAGGYRLVWEFKVNSIAYSNEETIFVLDNVAVVDGGVDDPDLDLAEMCRLTGTFYTPGGKYKTGVDVRFSPNKYDRGVDAGIIVEDTTATSDAEGKVEMFLVRGIEGVLSIAGTAVARTVKIPNQATISIQDLLSIAEDTFAVQEPTYYEAPRRS